MFYGSSTTPAIHLWCIHWQVELHTQIHYNMGFSRDRGSCTVLVCARSLSSTPIMMNTKYALIWLSLSSKPCMRTPCEPFTATSRMTTALRWVIVWDYHHNRGVMLWIPLHLLLCFPFSSFHASHTSLVSSIIASYFYLSLHSSCSLYLWLTYLVPFISDSSLPFWLSWSIPDFCGLSKSQTDGPLLLGSVAILPGL